MERLEAVEIVGNLCQCCLKALDKQIGKRSLASLQIQQTFQDFFGEDLGNGPVCMRCKAHLERFRNFKAEIQVSRAELLNDEFLEVKAKGSTMPEMIEEFLEPPFIEELGTHKFKRKNHLKNLIVVAGTESGFNHMSANNLRTPSKNKLYQCDQCPEKFFACKKSVAKHLHTIHLQQEGKQSFSKKCELRDPTRGNSKQKEDFERRSTKETEREGKLNSLLRRYNVQFVIATESTKSAKIFCPLCKKIMKALSFPTHLKLHQGAKEYNFMCEMCSRKCVSYAELIVHQRSHTKEKPFQCDLCPQKFFTCKKNLIRHLQTIHLKLKKRDSIPEKCELCDKVLQNSYLVRSHMAKVHPNGTYDGLKVNPTTGQYHCATCAAQYSTKHHYDNHVCLNGANDGANQNSCLICHTHCTSRAETLKHIQNEHAERIDDTKWKCSICHTIVLEKIVLHIESVHTTKSSKCSFCNKELKNRRCLRNHIYVVHENGSEIRKQKRKTKKLLMKTDKR